MPPKRHIDERLPANPVVEPAVGQGRMQRLNEAQLNQPMMLPLDEALRRQREAGVRRERGEEAVNPQPVNLHDPEFDRALFHLFPKYVREAAFARVGFYARNGSIYSLADPPIFYTFHCIEDAPGRQHIATFSKKERWEDWPECWFAMAAAARDKKKFLDFVNVTNALVTRNYIAPVRTNRSKLCASITNAAAAAGLSYDTLKGLLVQVHSLEDLNEHAYYFTDAFYRDQTLYRANHQ